MNTYTGTITSSVKENVEKIYNIGINNVIRGMSKSSIDFFSELRFYWCSPKAVEFYKTHANQLVEAINTSAQDIISLCVKIEEAHNIIANVNGAAPIIVDVEPYSLLKLPELHDNLDGIIGMNIEKVKYCTKVYTMSMNILLTHIDELPLTIDFLDPNRGQMIAYEHIRTQIKERLESRFKSILEDITQAEETEINEVRLTKEKAQEVMGG